jgi:aspartokinase/homoserine dehydrogenase 1
MVVLKFGGSSVGDAKRILNVIDIIHSTLKKEKEIAVVCSALQGVTDQLILCGNLAASGNLNYIEQFKDIERRHLLTAKELISAKNQSGILAQIKVLLNELEDVLHGIFLIKELSLKTLDFIQSFGERLSNYIIANTISLRGTECEYLDSRSILKTDDSFGNAKVDFELTNEKIREYFHTHKKLQIITGFIGSTKKNETTTLGRGGSDYSASIFGAALNAREIQIWTDVDGVLTADPRKVKRAFSLKSITYEEAMELSHFGAKVIHPPTMQPALNKKIPIRIKNTFKPESEGTLIGKRFKENGYGIKGISSIDEISLLRVQGSGMVGVAGVAQRIFGALAAKKINIILITQASSEHSLCFAVLPGFALEAKQAIEDELRFEIRDRLLNEVIVENDFSILAVVGEKMRNTPGIAGRIFQSLGKNGINISAIAQGSSELNISAVISKQNEAKALNVLHDAFFLSGQKTVNVFLVGTGLIGGTLLTKLNQQIEYLQKEFSLNIKIAGLANSTKMFFDEEGIDTSRWKDLLIASEKKSDIDEYIHFMKEINLPNSIFVDCTADDGLVRKYKEILESNISIVTPNKKANTGSYKYYLQLKESALKHNVKFLYETNVGAGLPIIGTLKDMVSSGDKVIRIEGVLSGTLSYIFNSFQNGKSFSRIVNEAREKGYTEPDPREDLNGMDVARKLLILAREIGQPLELKQIKVENLVPPTLRKKMSIDEFLNRLKEFDRHFEKKKKSAQKNEKVLRYIASLENGRAQISLQEIAANHPFYLLTGSDNILAITSRNYKDRPMVIKGPGAGADVTAAGVFADIIRISNYLS